MRALALPALSMVLLLAGCDLFGESPEAVAARRDAEGKAVGSACRHAMRAIEDCYALNPKAPKAAVFAGWREMDEYMRENKLEGVAPTIPVKSAKEAKEGKDGKDAEPSAKAGPSEGKPAAESKGKTAKSGSKSAKHADAAKADEGE
ncbi:MAG TPA: hypothetical protein VFL86_09610 [Burkholderiaceae bacterium]|nr:hypothetical protein [Burkholderiaceae bacterium]